MKVTICTDTNCASFLLFCHFRTFHLFLRRNFLNICLILWDGTALSRLLPHFIIWKHCCLLLSLPFHRLLCSIIHLQKRMILSFSGLKHIFKTIMPKTFPEKMLPMLYIWILPTSADYSSKKQEWALLTTWLSSEWRKPQIFWKPKWIYPILQLQLAIFTGTAL